MKLLKFGKTVLLSTASLVSSATMANNVNDYMEYKVNNEVYKIAASQQGNINEIIDLIDEGYDVSSYGVKKIVRDANKVSAKSTNNSPGGALNVHSTFRTGELNDYDQMFTYICPRNMFIKSISSNHSDFYEDRRFSLVCAKFTTDSGANVYRLDTKWTNDYVNNYDATFNFVCPDGQFLTGISSTHDNSKEDRIFKFNCAATSESNSGSKLYAEKCDLNGPTHYDAAWTLDARGGGAIVGVQSKHDNYKEDRQFSVTHCAAVSDF